tara:strand:+ start:2288 stop:3229 length:942 start_codon:yes stop_codon:yes gene_type:complete
MVTQQIRNIVNNQIDTLLVKAEAEIRNEGKKKLEKLQKQLISPKTVMKTLKVSPNSNSCSDAGMDKYEKIKFGLSEKMISVKTRVRSGIDRIIAIEDRLNPILEGDGPIGQIREMKSKLIDPVILPVLKAIELAVPVAMFVLKGMLADVDLGRRLNKKLRDAKSKIKEIDGSMDSMDEMLDHYQRKGKRIAEPIVKAKAKLVFIENELDKLIAFIHSHHLEYVGKCDALNNAPNISVQTDTITGDPNLDGGTIIPDPTGPTPLDDYLALLEQQYNDVYLQLQASNNDKFIKRIFALKENLEEDYNVSFRTINF